MKASDQEDDEVAQLLRNEYSARPDAQFAASLLAQLTAELPVRRPAWRPSWRIAAAVGAVIACSVAAALYLRNRPLEQQVVVPNDEPTPRVEPSSPANMLANTSPKADLSFAAFRPRRAVGFCPGRMLLASTGGDQSIRLGALVPGEATPDHVVHVWDVVRGGESRRFHGFTERVSRVTFSPDGRRLAGGAESRGVRVWEVATSKELYHIKCSPLRIAFSPDGRVLAIGIWGTGGGAEPCPIRLCDAATGKERLRVEWQSSPSFAFSADGTRLASVCADTIRIWDAATGKELRRFAHGHKQTVTTLGFSPDGKMLASGAYDSRVRLWDVVTGKELRRMVLPAVPQPSGAQLGTWSNVVAFSTDSKVLAAGTNNRSFVWEAATGRELSSFEPGPLGSAVFVSFSPDRKTLASVPEVFFTSLGQNGGVGEAYPTVHLWEVAAGTERYRFPASQGAVSGNTSGLWGNRRTGLGWELTGAAGAGQEPPPVHSDWERLWTDLGGADAAKAYHAASTMTASPRQAEAFLKLRLRPIAPVAAEELARLINQLSSERFKEREKATRRLEALGELAAAAIDKALASRVDLEQRRRLERLAEKLQGKEATAERLRTARAVEVLEHIGTPETVRLLTELAAGSLEAQVTHDAQDALGRLHRKKRTGPDEVRGPAKDQ